MNALPAADVALRAIQHQQTRPSNAALPAPSRYLPAPTARTMALRASLIPAIAKRLVTRSLGSPSPSAVSRSGLISRNYAAAARPRNDAIPFSYVRLVDRSGQLTAPQKLRAVLDDRRKEGKKLKEAVELVQTTPEPIVKYVDVSADYWKQKELHRKQVSKEGTHKEKEIQMTWAVSESDAAHKLKVARQALQQGQKVHIVYTHKKGQSRLSPEEMMARLEATVERLSDVGKAPKTPTVMPTGVGVVNMEPAGTNPPA